ncbi:MAG: hypothetical protein WDW36_004291 [Sanguina aurantia]
MLMNKLNLKSGISARQMAVRPARCMRISAQKKPEFGFSRDNELQVGRAAMLGFASSLLGEILTGKGALAQFGYELEINNLQQDELLVLAIVVLPPILSVILPKSQRFIPDTSLSGRTPGSLQDPSINLTNPKQFFGITEFGWSKQNELFVGRVAQLGFAASIIGEAITGKGPLAQFDFETGVPLVDTEFGLVVFIAFFVFAAINQGSGKFVEVDSDEGTGTTSI